MTQHIDHYAIVVGIDGYAQVPRLHGAVEDARRFAEWLLSADGGGLPQQNVHSIVSPSDGFPVEPDAARPARWEVVRALRNMGVESGRRIGERLYVYVAGYALGSAVDEASLLMANGGPTTPDATLGLRDIRTLIQNFGLFDRVLYVLDCVPLLGIEPPPSPLDLTVTPAHAPAPVDELVLLSGVMPAGHPFPEFRRGSLTSAVLAGLDGAAADASGQVTSTDLAEFARARLLAQGGGARLDVASSGDAFVLVGAEAEPRGTLVVEAPHWAASIRVLDSSLRPVPNVGPVEASAASGEAPRSETSLAPGAYRVEMTFEGATQQQLGLVTAGTTATIRRASWDGLSPRSAAPLASTTTGRDRHARVAEEFSRTVSWTDSPGGPSRLFLFVKSLDAKTAKTFVDGFYLLNANGELLVNFPAGGERNMRGGYFAFTADLPAGCYLLRRGRSGVRLRYQPIYLCAGWETQVFLSARNSPSLRTLSVTMAPLGAGFRADEPAADAAAAVLDGLRRGEAESVVTTDMVTSLLRGKLENPWLGIVAGYGLLQALESGFGAYDRRETRALLELTLDALQTIPDHPDVRALRLDGNAPAEAPFWYPPLLVPGVRRVREHATRFSDTVPLDSLTDYVLDSLVANAAWTAWRQLDRRPVAPPDADTSTSGGRRLLSRSQSPAQVARAALANDPMPPALPGYRAVSADPSTTSQPARPIGSGAVRVPLEHAALLSVAQDLTQSTDFESLPESISVDATSARDALLSDVQPAAVSQASGIPLARTEQALEILRTSSMGAVQSDAPTGPTRHTLNLSTSAVLRHALAGRQSSGASVSSDPPVGTTDPSASASASLRVTVAEVVGRLRAEGDRLAWGVSGQDGAGADEVRARAGTLYEIAAELLRRAELVAITGQDGVLLYGNLEFLALLGPSEPRLEWSLGDMRTQTADDRRVEQAAVAEQRYAAQREWEALLNTTPGRGVIVGPVGNPFSASWELQRTAVMVDESGTVQAFVNVVRAPGTAGLEQRTLETIGERLSELTLYASSLGRADDGNAAADLRRLDQWIADAQSLLGDGSTDGGR